MPRGHKVGWNGTIEQRFWRKVRILDNGCWEWLGAKNSQGYGQIKIGGKTVSAARWCYERYVSNIASGLEPDHTCKFTSCINPHHLEPVTPLVNKLRSDSPNAKNARKTHCLNGHPLSGENLMVKPNGFRNCRECSREKARQRYWLNKSISGEAVSLSG